MSGAGTRAVSQRTKVTLRDQRSKLATISLSRVVNYYGKRDCVMMDINICLVLLQDHAVLNNNLVADEDLVVNNIQHICFSDHSAVSLSVY